MENISRDVQGGRYVRQTIGFPAILAVLLLAGCADQHPIDSRDQAAGVLLSTTAVPWQQIASTLQPAFALTGDAAAQQIAPVTEEAQFEALRALGVTFGAGASVGPLKAPSSSGSATTSSSSVPNPTTPSGIPAGASLPAAPTIGGPLPIDPMLKYRAADALFQYVELLNADLSSSLLTDKYVPYVVRVKITIIPYRTNIPYDVLARISFFNSECSLDSTNIDNNCFNILPTVVPLLVTDDVERAANSAASETAKQFSLALSLLAPFAEASGSSNSVSQNLQTLLGQNYDSLLTVGRDTDNTLMARIGASYQAVTNKNWIGQLTGEITTRALVGQNYDIATIVLVPKEYFSDRLLDQPKLDVVAFTEFKNTYDGTVLPQRSHENSVKLFDSHLTDTVVDIKMKDWYSKYWINLSENKKFEITNRFVSLVQENRFPEFLKQLCKLYNYKVTNGATNSDDPVINPIYFDVDGCAKQHASVKGAQTLWARMASMLPDTAVKRSTIDLPFLRAVRIPDQIVSILDDGKSGMQGVVRASDPSLGATITATLKLATKDKTGNKITVPLVSKSSSFDQTTGLLTFQFPSAAASGISGVDQVGNNIIELTKLDCVLTDAAPNRPSCTSLEVRPGAPVVPGLRPDELKATYSLAPGAAGPMPGFTFTSSAKQIGEINFGGEVILAFPKWAAPAAPEDSAVITVDGASIVSASAGNLANGQIVVAKPGGTVALQLTNLVAGVPVTVQAEGRVGGKSTGKTSITLNVVPLAARTTPP